MWPFIGEYFRNLLETTVLASVQSSLPSALKPFKFGNIQLGDIVSVYSKGLLNINYTF